MTQIDFYFHVEDKLKTACALSAKAYARGLRVLAYAPDPDVVQKFSRLLWTTPATSFVPHCSASDRLAPVTPVIYDHAGTNLPHDQLLVNLGHECPPFFSRFQRLVEIVGIDEEDRRLARDRFRFYRDRGYAIESHDMSRSER
jgi:DNA polymerase-3 subunit chi